MGSNQSEIKQSPQKNDGKFIQNLQLYQEVVTESFGQIKILKLNQKPYRYYMLYRQTGINEQKTRTRLQQKLSWYTELKQHKNIVTIEYVDLKPILDMCIQKLNLDIYAKYYNFTLEMAVENKLKRYLTFRQADLVYILQSLLSVGRAFNLVIPNQSCEWFKIQNIYITPEGYVKIYPFPLNCDINPRKSQFSHKYTKSFLENQEVVLHMSRKTSDSNTNINITKKISEKEDLRQIGLIIFQLLILNKQTVQVKLYSNQKISNLLNMLQKQNKISFTFKEFLQKLIYSYKQIKYDEILSTIEDLKEKRQLFSSSCIKLDEGTPIMQSGIYQKHENLKQLSQHKQLRAGCISIVSNKTKSKLRQ